MSSLNTNIKFRYASCVGDNIENCAREQQQNKDSVMTSQPVFLGFSLNNEHAAIALYAQFYILLTTMFLIVVSCCKYLNLHRKISDKKISIDSFKLESGKNNEVYVDRI